MYLKVFLLIYIIYLYSTQDNSALLNAAQQAKK